MDETPLRQQISPQTIAEISEKPESGDKPNRKDTGTGPLGGSGTSIFSGIINEEYNQKLSGLAGMEQYEIMRKSDATVAAVIRAMELPIRSTRWYVQPAQDDEGETSDESWEIAGFLEKNLFELLDRTWDETLHEILTMLPFGFSVFEKVFAAHGEKVILSKLAFRKQTTIQKWQTQDGKAGVTQQLTTPIVGGENNGKTSVDIPAHRLVIFTSQREGDNYEGVSVLRSAYKHWYINDALYKFDAVRHERLSIGLPAIYLPTTASADDKAAALDIVNDIRSTERGGIVMPGTKADGWLLEFVDTHAGNGTNLFESIKHHNREIAKSVLAQFLDLGQESGSRSLSEDQSDLFLLALGAVAQNIADTFNRYIIPELVAYNFANVETMPKLEFDKLGDRDTEKFANTLATLMGAGVLKTDDGIEDQVREIMGLPPRDESALEEPLDENGEPIEDELIDPNAPPEGGDNPETTPAPSLDDLESELADFSTLDDEGDFQALSYCLDDLESAAFAECETSEAFARVVTDETKKKISEALIRFQKGLGKRVEVNTRTIDNANREIDSVKSEYEKSTAGIRDEITRLKALSSSGSKGDKQKAATAARALLAKVKAMKAERDAALAPVIALKKEATASRKQAARAIKERKAKVQQQIKAIREEVKTGRLTIAQAQAPLRATVSANVQTMRKLRADLRNLPKGASGREKREAIAMIVKGIQNENDSLRNGLSGLQDTKRKIGEKGKAKVEQAKAQSGVYGEHQHGEQCGEVDEQWLKFSALIRNETVTRLQNEVTPDSFVDLKRRGWKYNDFEKEAARPLTFAERKVNFVGIQRAMESLGSQLDEQLEVITNAQKQEILDAVKKAIEGNDLKALAAIKSSQRPAIADALTTIQKELFEVGKKTAATEMGVAVPATKDEVRGALRLQNDTLADSLANDIETAAKTAATQAISRKGGEIVATTASEAVGAASASIDAVLTKGKAYMRTLAVTGALNVGRSAIFERYPEKIYGFQFSAILDKRTSATCQSLDGRVVAAGSAEFYNYAPPRHPHCRSIWVEILQDESVKPKITGIPSSIPANPTIDTFKDLKTPVLIKDSAAIKVVREEIQTRKDKIAALQSAGTHPQRQADHLKRITELESALAKAGTDPVPFSEIARAILEADGIVFK